MPYKNQKDQTDCQKRFYERNKEYYKEKARKRKAEIREWFREYKSTLACIECGEDHPACVDFHHRDPKEKDMAIHRMVGTGRSIERLMEEIEKCDPMCANCHRKLHWPILDKECSL